jgi:hypothetical protein
MPASVRIANASGYWGDDPEALARQIRGGPIDYVTLDFLSEITMVILQRQRARDAKLGFAYDFVQMLDPLLPEIAERGIGVIANAGGINVTACGDRIAEACAARRVAPVLGMVQGDDLLPRLDDLLAAGVPFDNMDDGRALAPMRQQVVAANAYLGAWPIAQALAAGARIVITGRTTDAALTLAPIVHELGWDWTDFDRLAAGTVAGHVLECGAQATGGNLTDWRSVAPLDVGYPVTDVARDGSFVVHKHPGTGGRVSRATVTEQLLYEIGDPAAYLTPDVATDFRGLDVRTSGTDRVEVRGARGTPPPDQLKVTIVHRDGYRAVGFALISGPDAVAKAERLADMVWHRVGTDYADRRSELVGYRSCWGPAAPDVQPNEGVLRMAVRDHDRAKVERFAHTMLGFALQGPPGLGVFGGRPEVQPAYGYWPTFVPRDAVHPQVHVRRGPEQTWEAVSAEPPRVPTVRLATTVPADAPALLPRSSGDGVRVPLHRIAYARSGDKGDHANIGVAARSEAAFALLRDALPASRVASLFGERVRGSVSRYELPGLRAFNFLLRHALGGGGTLSLRMDHQGKTLAQALLQLPVDVPDAVLRATPADGEG